MKKLIVLIYVLLTAGGASAELASKSALVMEADTGRILFAKNPGLRLPPASIAKLMTAMVVLDSTDIDRVVTVSRRAQAVSPTKANLREGETVTIKTLLYAGLVSSANDAAYALSEAVAGTEQDFVRLMNKKAREIGMTQTRFINSTGLPGRGQYTTVDDLAKLMSNALMYPVIREIIGTRVTEVSTEQGRIIFLKNTDKLLWSEDELIGGKTGYTRSAGHCFVFAGQKNDRTVIAVLLGTPSRGSLWLEADALMERGFQMIANNEPPRIYLTKFDYNAKRPAYKKKARTHRSGKIRHAGHKRPGLKTQFKAQKVKCRKQTKIVRRHKSGHKG